MRRSSVTLMVGLVVLTLIFPLSNAASQTNGVDGEGTQDSLVFLPVAANPLAPIIPDSTVVLGEETMQQLETAAADLSLLTFAQMTPELAAVQSGDIIVSGPSQPLPFGFLRRVTAVSQAGGEVAVQTEPATLTEAVQQGQIGWSRSFSAADVISVQAREGVVVHLGPDAPADDEFYVTIPGLNDTCLSATGSVSVPQFHVDFNLEISWFALQEARFIVTQQVIDDIALTVTCDGSRDREWPLAQFILAPVVVPVGPVPVVFVPKLDLILGVEGTISAGLSFEAALDVTVRGGFQFADGSFDAIGEFTPIVSGSLQPATSASVKLYAGPELSLLVYGVSGPFLQNGLYVQGEVNADVDPWWALYWGLEANVGLELEILGHDIADWNAVAIGYRDVIVQAGGDEAPTSTFDGASLDGWTVNFGALENPGSGGSGGGAGNGYLYLDAPNDSRTSYFVAPDAYHGDWRDYGALEFDLWSAGGSYYTSGYSMYGDVYLANGERTARLLLGGRPASSWESFMVVLEESEDWTLGGGAATLEEVLANVTDFQIRAEYGVGSDETGLDNVGFGDPPVALEREQ